MIEDCPDNVREHRQFVSVIFSLQHPLNEKSDTKSLVEHPYFVLINGLKQKPQLNIDGKPVDITAPHEFREKEGVPTLKLEDTPIVELE
jgi:hypothetical protein